MARKANDYTYRVSWSEEDSNFIATVAEFPSLSCVDDQQEGALHGLADLVEDVLVDMAERGGVPPTPL